MKKVQKSFLVLVMLVLATISLSLTELKAADPTTGSLTIICHEQKNGDATTNPPLKGIEYTIYNIQSRCKLSRCRCCRNIYRSKFSNRNY